MGKNLFIGTWVLSKHLGIEHRSLKKIINRYLLDFQRIGTLGVKKTKSGEKGGATVVEYILSHKQSNYLIVLLKNTDRIRSLKRDILDIKIKDVKLYDDIQSLL